LQYQYYLNTLIYDFFLEDFSINHSYFSSSITCHTLITSYNSPNQKDQIIFGSQGSSFQHKWKGISLAHLPTMN
jgi:hypothetical protein